MHTRQSHVRPSLKARLGCPKDFVGIELHGSKEVSTFGDVAQEGMNGRATVYVDDPVTHLIK